MNYPNFEGTHALSGHSRTTPGYPCVTAEYPRTTRAPARGCPYYTIREEASQTTSYIVGVALAATLAPAATLVPVATMALAATLVPVATMALAATLPPAATLVPSPVQTRFLWLHNP